MSNLQLHNTLTNQLEKFQPMGEEVLLYVCGPTVYGNIHVGNARAFVVFDLLYRVLLEEYKAVKYVRNITDIDDKIIEASQVEGISVTELTDKYSKIFQAELTALGNLPPKMEPKATEHINDMIELINILIDKGNAYVNSNHVLFSIDTFASYGNLSNRRLDEMIAGARVEVAPYKQNPADFVLWKEVPKEQPGWDSPWGYGRPGWHIECSSMIYKCLGEQIDIHGGGIDLTFPHHENENAQSCCAFATKNLANFWIHNGHVTLKGDKMSRSVGNIFKLADVLAEYPGEVIRYALLSSHYRSPLDWDNDTINSAKQALDRLYRSLLDFDEDNYDSKDVAPEIITALHDDLNTPKALSILHELATSINKQSVNDLEQQKKLLYNSGKFMGLFNTKVSEWFQDANLDEEKINNLIKEREVARTAKDYAKADQLREQLDQLGVVIEDSKEGTTWRSK